MMYRILSIAIILVIHHCAGVSPLRAQTACDIGWNAAVTVSADSSVPTLPRMAVSDGTVHLLWYGLDTTVNTGLSASGLLYARLTPGAGSFSTPVSLLPAARALPGHIASSGGHVFVTCAAILDTFFGIVLFSSADAGASWTDAAPLLANAYPELIITTDSVVIIQYLEVETGFRGLLRSTDAGTSWGIAATRIRELSDIATSGNELHAVGPAAGGSQTEVGYYVSVDSGGFWYGPEIISTDDFVRSAEPRIALLDGGYYFAAWIDSGTVILRGSRNGGVSWGVQNILSESPASVAVDLAAGGPYVFAVWRSEITGSTGLRGRLSTDEGETFCPLTFPGGGPGASEPATFISDSTLHLAWVDPSGAAPGVFYREGELRGGGGIVETPPERYALLQSYPNPTYTFARIPFEVPAASVIRMELYNVLGERVKVLAGGMYDTGRYVVPVDVSELPSGVYFYRLTAAGYDTMKKMVVLR